MEKPGSKTKAVINIKISHFVVCMCISEMCDEHIYIRWICVYCVAFNSCKRKRMISEMKPTKKVNENVHFSSIGWSCTSSESQVKENYPSNFGKGFFDKRLNDGVHRAYFVCFFPKVRFKHQNSITERKHTVTHVLKWHIRGWNKSIAYQPINAMRQRKPQNGKSHISSNIKTGGNRIDSELSAKIHMFTIQTFTHILVIWQC